MKVGASPREPESGECDDAGNGHQIVYRYALVGAVGASHVAGSVQHGGNLCLVDQQPHVGAVGHSFDAWRVARDLGNSTGGGNNHLRIERRYRRQELSTPPFHSWKVIAKVRISGGGVCDSALELLPGRACV